MSLRRWHWPLVVAALVLVEACGGAPERSAHSRERRFCAAPGEGSRPQRVSADGEAEAARPVQAEALATASTGSAAGGTWGGERAEPECVVPEEAPPYEPLAFTLAPEEPARVLLASLELPPGAYFRPPTSSCQDVVVLVREGELEASGTGIAPTEARASLYEGDAVRFGPEGDGVLLNASDRPARTLLAVARDPRRFVRTTGWESLEPRGGDCAALGVALGASPLRVGSIATTELLEAGPDLRVRILLDAERHGAENAGLSILEGTANFAAPEHVHDGSAEVLLVDEGSGVLTLGEQEIDVRAGARLYIPAGVRHAFRTDGRSRFRAVQLYAPSGPEQRFRPAAE